MANIHQIASSSITLNQAYVVFGPRALVGPLIICEPYKIVLRIKHLTFSYKYSSLSPTMAVMSCHVMLRYVLENKAEMGEHSFKMFGNGSAISHTSELLQ
jgi:hypothetical protein